MTQSSTLHASLLKGKTVVLAASGGLDSCTVTRWLTDKGVKVICCTADLGQPDEEDFTAITRRLKSAGAVEVVILPAQEEVALHGCTVIQAQACYEGRYWNTTGIARYVLVSAVYEYMKKKGYSVFSHGATGRGNDQVRFQLGMNMKDPSIAVYAPWRDPEFLAKFRGRSEMIAFCQDQGIAITASKEKPYSTDANLLGLTHEAGILEFLDTPANAISPLMGVHPFNAPNISEEVKIVFEEGIPVKVQGTTGTPAELLKVANAIGGKHGVGIAQHLVENRFVGIKSRGVYEAPGMELLGTAYGLLLETILDRRAKEFFDEASRYIAKQIYQGYWFDLGTTMALSALKPVTEKVTGTVTLSLYKGKIQFVNISEVPHSLYNPDDASMEAVGSFDHQDSEGLLRVLGVSAKAAAQARQIR